MSASTHPLLPEGWSLHIFDETDAFGPDDVMALWAREGAMPEAEAERRVAEVFLVASDHEGALAGVVTAYLELHEQLRTPMWYLRGFVSSRHRLLSAAMAMVTTTFEVLEGRYGSGADTRAPGICLVLENESLARRSADAVVPVASWVYIGETSHHEPTFIRWFSGATVPLR